MSPAREVLVVGGTGMLRPAVHQLLHTGARVNVMARRPQRAATNTTADQRLVMVTADWRDPARLHEALHEAIGTGTTSEVLLWVHTPHDHAVHSVVDSLVSRHAVVVQLWASATTDPRATRPQPAQYAAPRSYRSLVLGFADTPTGTRWLTNQEISEAALHALRTPTPEQTLGRTEPWADHP